MAETIKEIADQLSGIFRHMLPGLLVVGAARVAHPSWFAALDLSKAWHIAVLSAIAVAAGNVWYVFHRYTIHQFIDWVIYWFQKRRVCGYLEWLSDIIDRSFKFGDTAPKLRDHLRFRSSQVILMFIVSEILFVLAFWHESGSFFESHHRAILLTSIIMFVLAIVQYYISHTLDMQAVERWTRQQKQREKDAA